MPSRKAFSFLYLWLIVESTATPLYDVRPSLRGTSERPGIAHGASVLLPTPRRFPITLESPVRLHQSSEDFYLQRTKSLRQTLPIQQAESSNSDLEIRSPAISLMIPADAIPRMAIKRASAHDMGPQILGGNAQAPLSRRDNVPTSLAATMFRTITAVVPSDLAAARLEEFYTILALQIETGRWVHVLPSNSLRLSLWEFELIFHHEKVPIPWDFIQNFLIEMAEWSSKEFTGFYEALLTGSGALNGLAILVQMKVKGMPLLPLGNKH